MWTNMTENDRNLWIKKYLYKIKVVFLNIRFGDNILYFTQAILSFVERSYCHVQNNQ